MVYGLDEQRTTFEHAPYDGHRTRSRTHGGFQISDPYPNTQYTMLPERSKPISECFGRPKQFYFAIVTSGFWMERFTIAQHSWIVPTWLCPHDTDTPPSCPSGG